MIKQLFFQFLIFLALFLLGFHLHEFILEKLHLQTAFSLKKVYLFHLGFSLLICINFIIFSTVDKIFQQLGFIYLVAIFLKIVVFCIIFYNPIFNKENLDFASRISLFIPMIIFLLTEAFFVAKILNKKG
ncbi:DUF6168 family protein [Polaribacter gangjinensis]|uniref:Uncharacterized protein n=1 Tax=Polaribacter gangjinensis TaxID=574710 RepID=A0A2S7WDX3_9FLAO|nr:DUF6168 family protein [Polaribacter gangjinensis]PQJ75462.1 hypothetical protein BTO13_09555 [Polaribacter gangjinensis]